MSDITINKNSNHRLDFDKLAEAYNIEFTLLKIIFEEAPITLSDEVIKKYGLQDYIIK